MYPKSAGNSKALARNLPPGLAEEAEGKTPIPFQRRTGRGAASNKSGRFEREQREAVDDGWGGLENEEALKPLKTHVTIERPKTIITRNNSPDISFDRSINPYRGCEHGCVYCFARPTHAYMGMSPGLDFETRLFAKEGAAELLERELGARNYIPKVIAIGTNTDPYQPIERHHRIMRSVLEVLARTQHPVCIVTKSALVTRDIDILAPMAKEGLAKVAISVTTFDRRLARSMEPRASSPDRRLEAIRQLNEAGIPAGVMVAPIVPGVTDMEMESILERAHEVGAREAGYVMLRLPLEVQDIFGEWLLAAEPDKYRRVMALLRSMREGKAYDSTWGRRMTGTGPYAQMTKRRFEAALQRIGYAPTRLKLRTDLFKPPPKIGDQLDLF